MTVLGDRFRDAVLAAYAEATAVFDEHTPHRIWPTRPECLDVCKTETICDELLHDLGTCIDRRFVDADAETWLRDGPDDLLDWYVADEGADTVRDAIVGALRSETYRLIMPIDRDVPSPVEPTFDG